MCFYYPALSSQLQEIGMNLFDSNTTPKVSLILSEFLHNMKHTSPTDETTVIKSKTHMTRQELNLSSPASSKKNREEVQTFRKGASPLKFLANNYKKRASEGDLYSMAPSNLQSSTSGISIGYVKNRVDFDKLDTSQRMEVKLSRKLTSSESDTVSELFKAQLNILTDDDDADADTLLIYALDMVDEGKSVGKVIEEVSNRFVHSSCTSIDFEMTSHDDVENVAS